jgi:hypothetical protein
MQRYLRYHGAYLGLSVFGRRRSVRNTLATVEKHRKQRAVSMSALAAHNSPWFHALAWMVVAILFSVRSSLAFGRSAIANTLMLVVLVTYAIFMARCSLSVDCVAKPST